ncbi:MAG: type secretion system protein, partial [Deltaproteobacteria bacterium]|nr:type secretion system protein [Deltaproteobacteria bacterium]
MTITQWLARKNEAENGAAAEAPPRRTAPGSHPYQELKSTIHRRLIDRLDLSTVADLTPEQLSGIIKTVVENMIAQEGIPLSRPERDRLVIEIQNETMGLGPLEPLLSDTEISDIMVNGPHGVFVERRGKIEKTDVFFKDNEHLMAVIERIVSKVGRRVDEASPMVDARLADGSRVNVIIPPLAIDGPALSIRRFGVKPLQMENLLANGSLTEEMAAAFEAMVKARMNILVSGGTGAGKTTFLNVLSSSIPDNERIITVEDAAELILQQQHTVRLETRPPNIEGKGAITQRDLVRNALRMRPDRIIVGEVRGAEALDMLQAMNTGHDGSISTIHANAPRDALSRIETMVLMAGFDLPSKAIREQISSALNVILQLSRMSDGTRKVVTVSEVTGMEGDVVVM